MAFRRVDVRLIDTGIQQGLPDRAGAEEHVGLMFAAGTDRRDAQEVEELVEEAGFIFFLVIGPC
jgi:hypothetical protein